MREMILKKLNEIEKKESVRILLAVESGSRAPAQTIEAPYSLSLRESSPALARA